MGWCFPTGSQGLELSGGTYNSQRNQYPLSMAVMEPGGAATCAEP